MLVTVCGGLGDDEDRPCQSAASICHGNGVEETGRVAARTNVWTQKTMSKMRGRGGAVVHMC